MSRPVQTSATIDIGIDRSDKTLIQEQIIRQLRDLVLSGRLKPQIKLPSTRALAAELGVARATVIEAYEQLASEGYLEMRGGAATRVAHELPDLLLSSSLVKKPELTFTDVEKRKPHKPAQPFRIGLTDNEHFPHELWGRHLGRIWRNPSVALVEHRDHFGWAPLRQAIAQHLHQWRGIKCTSEQVVMTAGGADAFDLIQRAVMNPCDVMWMENPGYPTAHRVFQQAGLDVLSLPIDGEGLVVAEGLRLAPRARAAFVTPARQYPIGVTMPLSRRLELLDWAAASGAVVIEDDYDSEYRYVGRPLPALASLEHQAQVIYVGSFSKVFSPLLRLGYLVVPPHMVQAFAEARSFHGAPPSLLAQPALAEFMVSGDFAIHIRKMRRIYAARRLALIAALKPGEGRHYTIEAAPAGLMLLLRLKGIKDAPLADELQLEGIEVLGLSDHYSEGSNTVEQGLLLGFAGFNEKQLSSAAAFLIAILDAKKPG